MSDTPQVLLAYHLKALKLPTFLREYDKQARQCAAEGVDHTGVNAVEKMHRRAGVKMHHGASSQRSVQLHIPI